MEDTEIRILRVLPSQVAEHWPLIKSSLLAHQLIRAEASEESMTNILTSLMGEKLVAWFVYRGQQLVFIYTTLVQEDDISGSRSLLLYSSFAVETMTNYDDYRVIFGHCTKLAKFLDCHKVFTYTDDARSAQILEHMGGGITTRNCHELVLQGDEL